jgi:hypothetical protein
MKYILDFKSSSSVQPNWAYYACSRTTLISSASSLYKGLQIFRTFHTPLAYSTDLREWLMCIVGP